jgi:ABC-type antimicrobial peptide transport system permease subunit
MAAGVSCIAYRSGCGTQRLVNLGGVGFITGVNAASAGELYGVSPIDPVAIAAAICVLLIVAAIAGLIPARRAARMNPTTALRHD